MTVPIIVGLYSSWRDDVVIGSFVFAGPAMAVWRVMGVEAIDGIDSARVSLEPVPAHCVPMSAVMHELPQPIVAAGRPGVTR